MDRPTSRPRRSQAERRAASEAALLGAAVEVVQAGGVRALTLAAVGERAGYSRGIVTHRFGSKQGLVVALLEHAQVGFVPEAVDVAPGLDHLLTLAGGYVRSLGRADGDGRWRVFMTLWIESVTEPDLRDLVRARDELFREEIRADLTSGVAAGTIRADVDPSTVAVSFVGQLRGIAQQRLLDPDAVDLPALSRSLPEAWRRMLAA